jgi:hypothetical protein
MCPSYVSKGGVWYPAKEKVSLVNMSNKPIEYPVGSGKMIQPGEPFIYEGPDRQAMFELFKAKQETFGMDFKHDPELLNRIRSLGYKDITQYCKDVGYDETKVQEEFEKKASKVIMHELPARVAAVEVMSGGSDTSGGGNDREGGWTTPKELGGKE